MIEKIKTLLYGLGVVLAAIFFIPLLAVSYVKTQAKALYGRLSNSHVWK
jgi:hypothetical protein